MTGRDPKCVGFCGLACGICENACIPDCRGGGGASECFQRRCCRTKGVDGCWECQDFPCDEGHFADSDDPQAMAGGQPEPEHRDQTDRGRCEGMGDQGELGGGLPDQGEGDQAAGEAVEGGALPPAGAGVNDLWQDRAIALSDRRYRWIH